MQFNRVLYKEKAKQIYQSNVAKVLIAGVILWLFGISSDSGSVTVETTSTSFNAGYNAGINSPIVRWLPLAVGTIAFLSIVLFVVLAPVTTMVKNYLKELASGNENPDALEVWNKKLFFRVAGVVILQSIGIMLGFIVFIIPGIYLIYAWRYAGLVAIDEPELSITDVFKRSMEIVNGNKLNLFIMDISFFGWYLVAGVVGAISFGLLGWLASIVLTPYVALTDVIAYRALTTVDEDVWIEKEIDENIIDI